MIATRKPGEAVVQSAQQKRYPAGDKKAGFVNFPKSAFELGDV
jgi:hypothetical protein